MSKAQEQRYLDLIVEAITNKGSNPVNHDRVLARQRKIHPTLWRALDGLVLSRETPDDRD
jgi:hypothetical protein